MTGATAKMLLSGRATLRPVAAARSLHSRHALLPGLGSLRAATLTPERPPSWGFMSASRSTVMDQVTPDVFDDAKVRTPKGWTKVLAVNTAAVGVELHGQDDTVAAVKAVRQAFETISLPSVIDLVPGGIDQARAKVKVAVPYPKGVDHSKVEAVVPFKHVELKVVRGGMSWNSGIILPKLGDPEPDDAPDASSDDEEAITAADEYKVAVAAVRIGW